jgi:hypothetical protein
VLGVRNLGGAISRDLLAGAVRVAAVARTPGDLEALDEVGALTVRADAADPGAAGGGIRPRSEGTSAARPDRERRLRCAAAAPDSSGSELANGEIGVHG